MFNNIDISSTLAASAFRSDLTVLTEEHCATLLIADAIQHMSRPVKPHANPDTVTRRKIERALAINAGNFDGSVVEGLSDMARKYADKIGSARQSDVPENEKQANTDLTSYVGFIRQLFENLIRNTWYRHNECLVMETPVADGARITGPDGAVGAFATKSSYTGWKSVSVESDVMRSALDIAGKILIVDILSTILLPVADSWVVANNTSTIDSGKKDAKKKPIFIVVPSVRCGWKIDAATSEISDLYSVEEVWADLQARISEPRAKSSVKSMMDAIGVH